MTLQCLYRALDNCFTKGVSYSLFSRSERILILNLIGPYALYLEPWNNYKYVACRKWRIWITSFNFWINDLKKRRAQPGRECSGRIRCGSDPEGHAFCIRQHTSWSGPKVCTLSKMLNDSDRHQHSQWWPLNICNAEYFIH